MATLTGRQRTNTWSFQISGNYRIDVFNGADPGGAPRPHANTDCALFNSWGGYCIIAIDTFLIDPPNPPGAKKFGVFMTVTFKCHLDDAEEVVLVKLKEFTIPVDTWHTFSGSYQGTVVFRVSTEELFERYDLDPALVAIYPDGTMFPIYGGQPQEDGPHAQGIVFWEQARSGTNFQLGMSLSGGFSESRTHAAVTSWTYDCQVIGEAIGDGATGTITITPTFNGVQMTAPYSRSTTGASITAAGPCRASESTPLDSVGFLTVIDAQLRPDLTWNLIGAIRSMDQPHPTGHKVAWLDRRIYNPVTGQWEDTTTIYNANPNLSVTKAQKAYTVSGKLIGALQDQITSDEHTHSRVHLDGFETSTEDNRDWRVLQLGQYWPAYQLSHTANRTIKDGTSTSGWAAGANTAISSDGTVLLAEVSGGTGSVTATPSELNQIWEAYRYLRVRIRSLNGANQPFSITTDQKGFGGYETGDALEWVEVDVDLCNPDVNDDWDDQNSRWPVEEEFEEPVNEGPFWGVNWTPTFTIGDLASGEDYEIEWVRLQRVHHAKATWSPNFRNWTQALENPVPLTEIRPSLYLDVDGRIIDLYDMIQTTTGSIPAFSFPPLADPGGIIGLADVINQIPGWVADPYESGFPEGFDNEEPGLFQYGGGGGWYDYENSVFNHGYDVPINSGPVDVVAQMGYDEVEAYPQAGNVWSGVSYAGSSHIPIAFCKVLRGQAHGIGHLSGPDTMELVPVVAYEELSPATVVGEGATSLVDGKYLTGLPGGRGTVPTIVELRGSETIASPARDWCNRGRFRTSFKIAEVVEESHRSPFNLQTRHGHYHRASASEGNIVYKRKNWVQPTGGFDVSVNVTASGQDSRPCMAYTPSTQRVELLFERENPADTFAVWSAYSDDDGATWSTPVSTITNARYPFIVSARNGVMLMAAFRYDSGSSGPGTIVAKRREPGGDWGALFTFKNASAADLAVADDLFSIAPAHQGDGRWVMVARPSGGEDVREYYSVDDGASWSLVA